MSFLIFLNIHVVYSRPASGAGFQAIDNGLQGEHVAFTPESR